MAVTTIGLHRLHGDFNATYILNCSVLLVQEWCTFCEMDTIPYISNDDFNFSDKILNPALAAANPEARRKCLIPIILLMIWWEIPLLPIQRFLKRNFRYTQNCWVHSIVNFIRSKYMSGCRKYPYSWNLWQTWAQM